MNKADSRLTPYDDWYSTCERSDATFAIYSPDLDPEYISVRLKIVPTSRQRVGEVAGPNSIGRFRGYNIGGWFLSSEAHVQSRDLRRHLDWLLAQLLPLAPEVLAIQELPGVKMRVNCIWWSAFASGGPTLWPEQMAGLASLNLECSFDISFHGVEDEDSKRNPEP